ncbi:MAG: VOC family protein, partial [Myxococcota bacterium]
GLFQGMFDRNILTFNPGLSNRGDKLNDFADVREIQRKLKAKGIELQSECDESGTGAASITLIDPDGNPVLIDQFS